MTDENKPQENKPLCPSCTAKAAVDSPSFPFCSKRCQQVDLNQWFSGNYIISRPIAQGDLDEV
ncbi:DNA gyrase inhibitor YacG [bacterium AH-315-I18]|nr:DNA gyrase inhibitor YacG [Phycisphaeraceae bacterium]MBN4060899.1 DNA gyrase inhibitor YacG [bacterium AH-315-I18]